MSPVGKAVEALREVYELPEPLGDHRFREVPAGSNLLLAGPTQTRKRTLALELLSYGGRRQQPAILVTTDKPANRLLEEFEDSIEGDLPACYVVDCTGSATSVDASGAAHVESVSSASDLTGIGVGIAKCMQVIGDDAADGLRLAHISLSTLLQYTSQERVFEFAHVVSGRISAAGYLGVWTLHTDSHDVTTINTLRGRFEYVGEIRELDDGTREIRVVGGPPEWREWRSL